MTLNPHCRIGTVRHKKSPNVIEIIPRPRPGIQPERRMNQNFENLCEQFSQDGMAGMVMVAWGFDGRWNRATEIHKDSFVGPTLLPSFVADILRRDTMKDVVHDTIMWID